MVDYFCGWNFSKAVMAAVFVFVTTADDAVWLVPVLQGKHRLTCAVTFIVTLLIACISCWLGCIAFSYGLISVSTEVKNNYERTFQLIAIIVTWAIALFLFIKKMQKVWRKRNRSHTTPTTETNDTVSLINATSNANTNYQAIPDVETNIMRNEPTSHENDSPVSTICFVIMMTLMGALDEIACFPSLMLGGTFTIQELSVGCFVASLLVLLIVYFALESCKPLLDCMDAIPLFVIVALIATVQTIEYVVEG